MLVSCVVVVTVTVTVRARERESIGWAGRATDQRESDACSGPSECRHGRPRSVGDATSNRDGGVLPTGDKPAKVAGG